LEAWDLIIKFCGHRLMKGKEKIETASMGRSPIEVIFFDLGNVILPFNHYPIAEKLSQCSPKKEFQDPQRIFSFLFDLQKGIINDFDVGKVSPPEFFHSVKKHFDLSISYDEFIPIWNDIFIEDGRSPRSFSL